MTITDTQVLFRIPTADGPTETELIDASRVDGEDRFRLAKPPVWAYGVSVGDVVLAPYSEADGHHVFMTALTKSGHRTVRVVLEPPLEAGNESEGLVQELEALGCRYEAASKRYVIVVLPPGVELGAVREHLINCDAIWEHADPTYASLFPDEAPAS
jgi:hypothetical protein